MEYEMSHVEKPTYHLWCARCACERAGYLDAMTSGDRLALRGGLLRAAVRCSLCLMSARAGSYALAVTFYAELKDYEVWEDRYLDVEPLKPLAPERIPLQRDRIWSRHRQAVRSGARETAIVTGWPTGRYISDRRRSDLALELRPLGSDHAISQDPKETAMTPYGMELILDLKGCQLDSLDRPRLERVFVELCQVIDMKRHGEGHRPPTARGLAHPAEPPRGAGRT